ncbi:MAG: hypothetical protein WCL02_03980 [bacterium]
MLYSQLVHDNHDAQLSYTLARISNFPVYNIVSQLAIVVPLFIYHVNTGAISSRVFTCTAKY